MRARRPPSPETRAKIARGMAAYQAQKLAGEIDNTDAMADDDTAPAKAPEDTEPIRPRAEPRESGMFWRRTPRHLLGRR